tara:strand:- start:85 stop:300 length:216 start_codon:yes stop_codon:yes gene_type:complete
MWCPHCDRSCQDVGGEQYCDGCNAKFIDDVVEAPAPARTRRNRRTEDAEVVEEEPIELEDATILVTEVEPE